MNEFWWHTFPMEFNDYQKEARKTAVYPNIGNNHIYPALGLGEEAGEVLGKISKLMRDKNNTPDAEFLAAVEKELGDVLWFTANLAAEFNIALGTIAETNLKKLADRAMRNTLHGSGDVR